MMTLIALHNLIDPWPSPGRGTEAERLEADPPRAPLHQVRQRGVPGSTLHDATGLHRERH